VRFAFDADQELLHEDYERAEPVPGAAVGLRPCNPRNPRPTTSS